MEAIVCRSSEQIYEDNVCELHTRLTQWLRTLRNERTFDWRDRERKTRNVEKLSALVLKVEYAIENDVHIDIRSTELLGIHLAAMRG